MGSLSRTKGSRFETWIKNHLQERLPNLVTRKGYGQSAGGKDNPDVVCGPFAIQAKVGKRPPTFDALEQAANDAPKGYWPIAVVKRDREQPVVLMRLEDFVDLVEEWDRRGQMV